jgi:hypothetical protein
LRLFVSRFSAWLDGVVLSPQREGKNRDRQERRNKGREGGKEQY